MDAVRVGEKTGEKTRWDVCVYVHSVGWIAAAAFITYFGKLPEVVQYDVRVLRLVLYVGVAMTLVGMGVILYLAFYLPIVQRIPVDDAADYCPRVVYLGAGCGVGSYIAYIIALWPVWGLGTPIIVSVLAVAAVFSLNLIPSF